MGHMGPWGLAFTGLTADPGARGEMTGLGPLVAPPSGMWPGGREGSGVCCSPHSVSCLLLVFAFSPLWVSMFQEETLSKAIGKASARGVQACVLPGVGRGGAKCWAGVSVHLALKRTHGSTDMNLGAL